MLNFRQGDLIHESKPFVHMLNQDLRTKRCDFCFQSNSQLRRCSHCKYTHYCNVNCQREAWSWYHKQECPFLASRNPDYPKQSVLYFSRLVFLLQDKNMRAKEEVIYGHARTFQNLMSHGEEIRQDAKRCQQFEHILQELQPILNTDETNLAFSQLLQIFGKMVINSFCIYNEEMQVIGSGLYLGPSVLNHSCVPNAVTVFRGTTLLLRALVDISVGDITQVFISYVDQMDIKSSRTSRLRRQYYFTCKCTLCASQVDSKLEKSLESDIFYLLSKESQQIPQETFLQMCEAALNRLPPHHVLRGRVLSVAMDSAVDLSQWQQVLDLGQQYLPFCREYLGSAHPTLGVLLAKLGKVCIYLGDPKMADYYLQEAESVVRISYGADHHFYKEVTDLIYQNTLLKMELSLAVQN